MHKINYSIIVPTHESSSFVENLLLSIPSRDDLEIIVIDDHSVDFDNLKQRISTFECVRLIKNNKKKGAGNARQIGLENARGKWVIFADSDDKFTVNLNDVLNDYVNSNADIVLFVPKSEKLDGSRSGRCDYYHYLFNKFINGKINEIELSYRLTNVWSKIYRKEAILNASFQDTLVANDVQFAAQAAYYTRNEIVVDKRNPIYVLTERTGSITTIRRGKISKYLKRAKIRMTYDKWFKNKMKYDNGKRIHIRRYESILRSFFANSSYNEEKRSKWAINPIKNILRIGSIMQKAIFALTVKRSLYKRKHSSPVRMEEVDIAYCIDENVVEQSLISLVSVLENNNVSKLNAHFVFVELSKKDKAAISALTLRYNNLRINFHTVRAEKLQGLFSRKYTKITPIGYGRFLFAEIFPNLKKILYMDTDVVCVNDMSYLWTLDIENEYAAAVSEYPSWRSTGMTKNKEKARLFIAQKNEMINSGVMLFNLDYMRQMGAVEILFKTDKLIINRMNQDQDIYDVVFEGKMKILPVTYNLTAINYTQNLNKIFNAVFIHYTGPNKPWNDKTGIKKIMALLDLRLPYYKKYEKVLKNET